MYFVQHNFPLIIPASKPLFSPFSIFCCLVMARQTDGAFSDSGFDPSEYSVSSYPVVCHIIWYLGYVIVTLCFWSLGLACQSISGLAVKDLWCHLSSVCRFLCWHCQKGYSCVQGKQHRLDKCLFSTKYRYYGWNRGESDISDWFKREFVLHLDFGCLRRWLCLTSNDFPIMHILKYFKMAFLRIICLICVSPFIPSKRSLLNRHRACFLSFCFHATEYGPDHSTCSYS